MGQDLCRVLSRRPTPGVGRDRLARRILALRLLADFPRRYRQDVDGRLMNVLWRHRDRIAGAEERVRFPVVESLGMV